MSSKAAKPRSCRRRITPKLATRSQFIRVPVLWLRQDPARRLRRIEATGSGLQAPVPLMDFAEISRTMGFEDVWAFERRHAAE